MSGVRLLVGTRKGAFILTSDDKRQKWDISGPHFAGWEIYHINGSPANPNRIYASQSSGWFGQIIQRSDDGGLTWEAVGNNFEYRYSINSFNKEACISLACSLPKSSRKSGIALNTLLFQTSSFTVTIFNKSWLDKK